MDANGIEPKEIVSANKKLGKREASDIAKTASKLIVSKGKKISEFKSAEKNSKAAIEAMLGPTGNLRAPTIRVGKTVIVGFSDETYGDALL